MVRFWQISVLILVCWGLTGCGGPSMRRYINEEYSFSLLLPAGWQREEGSFGTIILVKAPEKQTEFQTNINLTTGDLRAIETQMGRKISLAEVYEVNKEAILRTLPGIKENLKEDEVLAGKDRGMLLSFDCRLGDLNLKFLVGVWMKAGRLYTLSCATEKERFYQYLPIFKKTISSLRLR